MGRDAPGFEAFDGAFGEAGLFRQLGLGEVLIEADEGQAPAQFAEEGSVGGEPGSFHTATNMTTTWIKVNKVVLYDEL